MNFNGTFTQAFRTDLESRITPSKMCILDDMQILGKRKSDLLSSDKDLLDLYFSTDLHSYFSLIDHGNRYVNFDRVKGYNDPLNVMISIIEIINIGIHTLKLLQYASGVSLDRDINMSSCLASEANFYLNTFRSDLQSLSDDNRNKNNKLLEQNISKNKSFLELTDTNDKLMAEVKIREEEIYKRLHKHLESINLDISKSTDEKSKIDKLYNDLKFQCDSLDEKIKSNTDKLNLISNPICVICTENKITLAFNPCGHLVCCSSCVNKIDKCPICKSKINSKLKIFFP